MEIETATPADIDRQIAALNWQQARLISEITRVTQEIHKVAGDTRSGQPGQWGMSDAAAENALRSSDRRDARQVLRVLDTARDAAVRGLVERDVLTGEYHRRGGWRRWYLVDRGHLHWDVSSERCSRTPRTDHFWLVEYSGRSDEEMIEAAGDRVCTVCFPDAPVRRGPAHGRVMTPSEAERAARAEQLRRDRVAKLAEQITTVDGAPLKVDGDLIKTERGAWNRALQAASDLAMYGRVHPDAEQWVKAVRVCVDAVARRRGVLAEPLMAELTKKVAAKARRDGYEVRYVVTTLPVV